jgi:hypothetical protein
MIGILGGRGCATCDLTRCSPHQIAAAQACAKSIGVSEFASR